MNDESMPEVELAEERQTRIRAELELDWEALAVALENQLPDSHSYLDLKTGKVFTAVGDPGTVPSPPGSREDYLYITPRPSREGYRTMQRFIEKVSDRELRDRLSSSLVGKGAFRRFKDQLIGYPEIRQLWFAFKDAEVYEYARSWLEREGVKPLNQPPAPSQSEPNGSAAMISAVQLHKLPAHRRDPVPASVRMEVPGEVTPWASAVAPYDRREVQFRPGRSALLVVDMQNAFVHPDGESFLPQAPAACERLVSLVAAFRKACLPVIFTRHVHQHPQQDGGAMARWWRNLILEGSWEAELFETLQPTSEERVITKCRYSAFAGTPLELILRSLAIEDLVLGGVMTNLCCETTARDAFVRDFNVFLLADATAAPSDELHLATLRNIAYGFGRVLGVAEALDLLAPARDS